MIHYIEYNFWCCCFCSLLLFLFISFSSCNSTECELPCLHSVIECIPSVAFWISWEKRFSLPLWVFSLSLFHIPFHAVQPHSYADKKEEKEEKDRIKRKRYTFSQYSFIQMHTHAHCTANDVIMVYNSSSSSSNSSQYMVVKSLPVWFKRLFFGVGCCHLLLLCAALILSWCYRNTNRLNNICTAIYAVVFVSIHPSSCWALLYASYRVELSEVE